MSKKNAGIRLSDEDLALLHELRFETRTWTRTGVVSFLLREAAKRYKLTELRYRERAEPRYPKKTEVPVKLYPQHHALIDDLRYLYRTTCRSECIRRALEETVTRHKEEGRILPVGG